MRIPLPLAPFGKDRTVYFDIADRDDFDAEACEGTDWYQGQVPELSHRSMEPEEKLSQATEVCPEQDAPRHVDTNGSIEAQDGQPPSDVGRDGERDDRSSMHYSKYHCKGTLLHRQHRLVWCVTTLSFCI